MKSVVHMVPGSAQTRADGLVGSNAQKLNWFQGLNWALSEPDRRSDRLCGPIAISEALQSASARMQTLDRCQRLKFGCAVGSLAQERSMTP